MFFSQYFTSAVSNIPPMLHTHSVIYHPRCIMFFSQYFSFPCQYYSNNATYSFSHLPPTLYNVLLPVLQFPLSVLFQQCYILIHSSTTDAVQFFPPSTSVSPISFIPPLLYTHSFIHTFIHLPLMLYCVFLPALQFPLSVSFHQCPILIHPSTTHAV